MDSLRDIMHQVSLGSAILTHSGVVQEILDMGSHLDTHCITSLGTQGMVGPMNMVVILGPYPGRVMNLGMVSPGILDSTLMASQDMAFQITWIDCQAIRRMDSLVPSYHLSEVSIISGAPNFYIRGSYASINVNPIFSQLAVSMDFGIDSYFLTNVQCIYVLCIHFEVCIV